MRESSAEREYKGVPQMSNDVRKYEKGKYFTPKMLNQADEVSQLI